MKFSPRISGASAALVASLLMTAPAAAEIEWRESYYNPSPAEGDLILPMPCGGAMAFRPVETPNTDGTIGDVRVTLGQEGDDQPYLNGLRRSYVSGAFKAQGDNENPKGLFWIGKYEIAEAQWDAVMSETCPEKTPRKRAFVPVVDVSRLDFARFAQAYTLWLMENAPDVLPVADETRAYLRLPTEDEWEFAARGGLAVEDVAFRAPRPPTGEGREQSEFIAHGGTDSAGGKVQVIGTLAPNPLGLHDMLGNVAEYVETPFAMVRHGRLHGQAGGIVKRGGDARTPLAGITSATRFEVPPYDVRQNAVTSDRYTGARLAIAGLSITSGDQTARLIEDLDRLSAIDPSLTSASSEEEIAAILDDLESYLDAPRAQQQLAVIRDTIAAGRAARNTQRDRSIRLILESGTLICDQAVQRLLNALAIRVMLPSYDALEDEARDQGDAALVAEVEVARQEARDRLASLEGKLDAELTDYGNLVEGLAGEFAPELLTRQAALIRTEIAARGERRSSCLAALDGHLKERAAEGYLDIEIARRDLEEIALAQSDAPPPEPEDRGDFQ